MSIRPSSSTRAERIAGQRREAVRLKQDTPDLSNADIARRLGVDRTTVAGWLARHEREGEASFEVRPTGSPSALTEAHRTVVSEHLLEGALANGYPTDGWTLDRVADLIQKLTGISYSPGHVWYVLRDLGFTCQKPEKQAKQRNEAKIKGWVQEQWPQIKRGP